MTPKEESAEDWLRKQIQNTVEDGLAVRVDDVASLRKTPGDGVEEPQKDGKNTAGQVRTADVGSEGSSVLAGDEDQDINDVEESQVTEYVVSPLSACQFFPFQIGRQCN